MMLAEETSPIYDIPGRPLFVVDQWLTPTVAGKCFNLANRRAQRIHMESNAMKASIRQLATILAACVAVTLAKAPQACGQDTPPPGALIANGFTDVCGAGGCAYACDMCPCACGPRWHVSAELLYWRADSASLDFAVSRQPAGEAIRGQVENLDLEFSPGTRVGVWYGCEEDCQLGVSYTYFDSDDDRTVSGPANSIVLLRAPAIAGFDRGEVAIASASVQLDIADLEASRWFDPCGNLAVRGFAGLRYASLDQDLDIFDRDGANTAVVNNPSDFEGLGLRAGVEGYWKLGDRLSLFGRGAIIRS